MNFSNYDYGDAFMTPRVMSTERAAEVQKVARAFWNSAKTIYLKFHKGVTEGQHSSMQFQVQLWVGAYCEAVVLLHCGTGIPFSVDDIRSILGLDPVKSGFSICRVAGKNRLESLWDALMDKPMGNVFSYDNNMGIPQGLVPPTMPEYDPPEGLHPKTWEQKNGVTH